MFIGTYSKNGKTKHKLFFSLKSIYDFLIKNGVNASFDGETVSFTGVFFIVKNVF